MVPFYIFIADKTSKSRAANGLAEGLEFTAFALGDEFDTAIGQVADDTGDLKTGGDIPGGVTKADALHPARIKNSQALAILRRRRGWRLFRHGRMKPKPDTGRNVFWSAKTFFLFSRIVFDRFENLA